MEGASGGPHHGALYQLVCHEPFSISSKEIFKEFSNSRYILLLHTSFNITEYSHLGLVWGVLYSCSAGGISSLQPTADRVAATLKSSILDTTKLQRVHCADCSVQFNVTSIVRR